MARASTMIRARARGAAMLLALAAAPAPAASQLSIFAQKNLDFGTLIPGTPLTVPPSDGLRRAELELFGSGEVTIVVEVPSAMTSPKGKTLPLHFQPGDGVIRFRKGNNTTPFTPGQQVTVRIPKGQGGVFLWIGGTADPPTQQPPGTYSATLTVRVFTPGT